MGKKRKVTRPRGRATGTPYPETSTPAVRSANRLKNLKHGRYSETLTPQEARSAILARESPEAAAVLASYTEQIVDGRIAAGDGILARSLTEIELIRRRLVDDVDEKGTLVEEGVFNALGMKTGSRLKANPSLEHLHEVHKTLGHTASDQLLTRKARGEGAVDAANAMRLARDLRLRENSKSRMPAPPLAIETTAKKAS